MSIDVGFIFKATDEVTEAMKGIQNQMLNMKNMAGNILKTLGIAASFGMIKKGIEEANKSWGEAEEAQISLAVVTKNSTKLSKESYDAFLQQAAAIQALTGQDEELIIKQQTMLAGMGLNKKEILSITQAAIDLASNGTVPLQMAFRSLGQSYSGNIGLLGRHLPQLKELTKEQLKNGEAVKMVAEKYAGAAENMASTVTGQRKVTEALKGEMMESIGKAFSPLEMFLNKKMLQPMFTDLGKFFDENALKITNFFLNLPEIISLSMSSIIPIIKEILTGGSFTNIMREMLTILIAVFKTAATTFIDLIITGIESLPDLLNVAIRSIGDIMKPEYQKRKYDEKEYGGINKFFDVNPVLGRNYKEYIENFDKAAKNYIDEVNKSLSKIGKNTAALVGKSAATFEENLVTVKKSMGSIGKAATDITKGTEVKKLMDAITKILGKEIPAELKSSVQKLKEEIQTETDNTLRDAKKYIGAGGYSGSTGEGAISDATSKVGRDAQASKVFWEDVTAVFENIGNNLMNIFSDVGNGVKSLLENLLNQLVQGTIAGVLEMQSVKDIMKLFADIIYSVVEAIKPLIDTIFPILGNILLNVGNIIINVFKVVLEIVSPIIIFIVEFLSALVEALKPLITMVMNIIRVVLIPIFGILMPILNVISNALLPVLEILGPVFELVGKAFIFLYNYAIMPLTNAIIFVFNAIYNIAAFIWNAIASALNALLGWLGVNLSKMAYRPAYEGFLQTIDYKELADEVKSKPEDETGTDGQGGTTVSGGAVTVQRVPDIYVYQTFTGNVVGSGGMVQVGQFVVDAIQAYTGAGGKVSWNEAKEEI